MLGICPRGFFQSLEIAARRPRYFGGLGGKRAEVSCDAGGGSYAEIHSGLDVAERRVFVVHLNFCSGVGRHRHLW